MVFTPLLNHWMAINILSINDYEIMIKINKICLNILIFRIILNNCLKNDKCSWWRCYLCQFSSCINVYSRGHPTPCRPFQPYMTRRSSCASVSVLCLYHELGQLIQHKIHYVPAVRHCIAALIALSRYIELINITSSAIAIFLTTINLKSIRIKRIKIYQKSLFQFNKFINQQMFKADSLKSQIVVIVFDNERIKKRIPFFDGFSLIFLFERM